MDNIKYTTDGKKVVVIGNLNSKETIVQEIFVSDGSEIPSGEQFIVKSLHDKPAESWKEREIKKINNRYNELKNEVELKSKRLRQKRKQFDDLIKKTSLYERYIDEELFKEIIDFIRGDITHIVDLSSYEIKGFSDLILNVDRYDSDLKLLTLFGGERGQYGWKLNQYSDGSGTNRKIIPCLSFEDAKEKLDEYINNQEHTYQSMINAKEKFNLNNPNENRIKEFNFKKCEAMEKSIHVAEENLSKQKAGLAALKGQ